MARPLSERRVAAHDRWEIPGRRSAPLDPNAVPVLGHPRQARASRIVGRRRDRPCHEPRSGASRPRRSATRGHRPRPRVRTVPRPVPAQLALALPGRAARGGEAGRRDPGPVAEHRRRSDRVDVDPGLAGARDPAGIVARRPARRSEGGVRAPPRNAAIRVVGRNARAAQEPGAAGARVPAGRSRRRAHARAGGRARMARGSVGRGARAARPRDHRVHRRGVGRRARCALPRSGRLRVSIVVRGVRPAGRGGDGARRADARVERIVAPPGRRRRRPPGGPHGRLGDRRGTRSPVDGAGVRRGLSGSGGCSAPRPSPGRRPPALRSTCTAI